MFQIFLFFYRVFFETKSECNRSAGKFRKGQNRNEIDNFECN